MKKIMNNHMTLEQQVASLELSQKLKELGVPQKSLFWWVKGEMEYGYEGEWNIKAGNNYFIFNHIVGHKFDDYDFQVNAGDMGETDEDYAKYLRRGKKLIKEIRKTICSAFTVAELGQIFPQNYCTRYDGQGWSIYDGNGKYVIGMSDDTEANARAKLLIHLIENKLITL